MKKLLILLFSILILPVSVNASDVYYCSDDAATGFNPKENFKQTNYTLDKFKIMIDFENKKVISKSIGLDDEILDTKCFYDNTHKSLYCMNEWGQAFSINKLNLRFIKGRIYNRVDLTDDIVFSTGTCEKF